MAARFSTKTRARDIDRAQTCGLLDAGYGDGQLDPSEHQSRTARAMKAKTLAELDSLVSDLQIPAHLVEAVQASQPAPRRRVPGRAVAAVAAVVVALVAVCGTVVYVSRVDAAQEVAVAAEPAPAPLPAAEPQPIVIESHDPLSPDGIREFVRQLGVKFGDLRVDQVTFYATYVFLTRMLPDQPHREQDWSFQGGFEPTRAPDSRTPDTATVDLALLDVDRLTEVITDGPRRVGLLSAEVSHIFVRPDRTTDEALISVLFEDSEKQTGSVDTRLDGTIVDVFPVGGR
ncbi:DUF1707 SHOCT-like domain-containing protein [Rhodococcus sp. OK519]|uniref:DUF1707 SHOCT-like domain-containing protein n=1 Tax=Rhodococcus sp. OK519 TaxID=2135729 RepID=UPI000D33A8AB